MLLAESGVTHDVLKSDGFLEYRIKKKIAALNWLIVRRTRIAELI